MDPLPPPSLSVSHTHIQRPRLNGIYNDLTLGPLCVNDLQPLPAQTHAYWQTITYTFLLLRWDKVRGVNTERMRSTKLTVSLSRFSPVTIIFLTAQFTTVSKQPKKTIWQKCKKMATLGFRKYKRIYSKINKWNILLLFNTKTSCSFCSEAMTSWKWVWHRLNSL